MSEPSDSTALLLLHVPACLASLSTSYIPLTDVTVRRIVSIAFVSPIHLLSTPSSPSILPATSYFPCCPDSCTINVPFPQLSMSILSELVRVLNPTNVEIRRYIKTPVLTASHGPISSSVEAGIFHYERKT